MLRLLGRLSRASRNPPAVPARLFSAAAPRAAKRLPPRPPPPPESEIVESFVKGSGPGGQKINKTNSAVQLKHIPTGIVVKSQATRSRSQNRKHARELLAQRIDDLANGDQSRSATVAQLKRDRAASAAKKSRRKYRKLAAEKAPDDADGAADGEADGEAAHDADGEAAAEAAAEAANAHSPANDATNTGQAPKLRPRAAVPPAVTMVRR